MLALVSSHSETGVCSARKGHQNSSHFKIVGTKIIFKFFLFQSKSWLWESTAAIFRQSAGYVYTKQSDNLHSHFYSKRTIGKYESEQRIAYSLNFQASKKRINTLVESFPRN